MRQLTVDELHKRIGHDYARGICQMLITILDIHGMVIVDKEEYLKIKATEDDLK